MKNCPVCSNPAQMTISYCQKCGWPLAFADADFRDPDLKQATINWAHQKYQETEALLKLNREVGRSSTPALSMNVQMAEHPQMVEPLQMKINALADRLQVLENLFQSEQKSTAGFMEQQHAENRKIYSQQKSLYEISNQHTRLLNEINSLSTAAVQAPVSNQLVSTNNAIGKPLVLATAGSEQSLLLGAEALVTEYNKLSNEIPSSWREQSTNVSIAPEAFARLRDGDDNNITFNKDRKGNYLILPRGGYYYLVPNKQRKIIAQIYITTKAIYDCDGYNESYRDFQLIKPALVSEESIDCWRLSQKGTLQFI